MHDVDDYPDAKPVPGLVIYRYDAPLCFADAEDFRHQALAAVDQWNKPGRTPVRWFVLNAEANVEIDLTALDAVEQLRVDLAARGFVFAMARVEADLCDDLDAAGLTASIRPACRSCDKPGGANSGSRSVRRRPMARARASTRYAAR